MSKVYKDTLVRATLTTSTARRLTIPNMGETLYLRIIHDDGVIEFVPQITMKSSVIGGKNGE